MDTDKIDPELRQQPPRQIRNRRGVLGTILPFWWVFLPHTWIAVIAPCVFVFYLLLHFSPQYSLSGLVTEHHTSVSSKGNKSYHVAYRYSVDGISHEDKGCVDAAVYKNIDNGETETVPIDVSRNPIGDGYISSIHRHDQVFLFAFFGLWVTIWTGGMSIVAYTCCASVLRGRHLARHGIPVLGTLSEISQKRVKSRNYYVIHYSYVAQVEKDGLRRKQEFTGKIDARSLPFSSWSPGQSITVLFDPKNPKVSIPYVCSEYVAC